jgi:hypothetical protein
VNGPDSGRLGFITLTSTMNLVTAFHSVFSRSKPVSKPSSQNTAIGAGVKAAR